ncbi:MAG: acyltransferase family protein [Lachnospiraceae bacterium]|nr:acyltransferase family protein [Lachnospiraceae bacterium]
MKRDERMDIIKGIAIILMVVGHSGVSFKGFIYLFHMAVFFMVSGYLFSFRKITSVKEAKSYVIRKIKGIWWPYFLWNAIYTILNNFFIWTRIYSDKEFVVENVLVSGHALMSIKDMAINIIKGFFMLGRTEMGGAFWFLRTLFVLSILFGLIDYMLNKIIRREKIVDVVHLLIALGFMCAGYAANLLHIKSLVVPTIFSVYVLYFFGYAINRYEIMKHLKNWVSILIGLFLLLGCNGRVEISLGNNSYGNPLYLVVCSLGGWLLIYGVADVINRCRHNRIWRALGVNSLPIVVHHFWCFKIVTYIQILLLGYSKRCLAAFPYLNADGLWWVAYTVVGCAVPLLLAISVKKGKEKIKSHA